MRTASVSSPALSDATNRNGGTSPQMVNASYLHSVHSVYSVQPRGQKNLQGGPRVLARDHGEPMQGRIGLFHGPLMVNAS